MKKLLTILFATVVSLGGYSQEDAKAKAILDKLSAKTKSYQTIKANFQYTINNKNEGINESQSGNIEIKGSKYTLSIQGQDISSDGKYMYTVLKESEEVHINSLPEDEDYISPNKIFTLYEDGFKYKFVKEENGFQIINLYPKDVEEKSFHRVALYIHKAKGQIDKIEVFGKEGTNYTYQIKTFTPNSSISDTKFSFDKAKHPNYEIIDLTDD